MDPKPLKSILSRLAEESIPADQVDLWPKVRRSLEAGRIPFMNGDQSMKSVSARTQTLKFALIAGLGLLLLAAALFATPSGEALAQSVWKFFTRIEGSLLLIPTQEPAGLVELTPEPTGLLSFPGPTAPAETPTPEPPPQSRQPFQAECGSLLDPRCSLEQVQRRVSFPLSGLSELPPGFAFAGATGGPEQVILAYQSEGGLLFLAQTRPDFDRLEDWQIAADTQVEAVSVAGAPGEYVLGGWGGLGLEQPGEIGWDAGTARQTLRWEAGGLRYTLWFLASKSGNGAMLDKAGLVRLAESLAGESELDDSPLPGLIELEQAERMAGFSLIRPGWLPQGFRLRGASYGTSENAVCQHYRYGSDDAAPLVIFQSRGWMPGLDRVRMRAEYNGQPVEIPMALATLAVRGAENGQATWASNGVTLEGLCGASSGSINKLLMWRAQEVNFIIGARLDQFEGAGFLTNLEMVRLAESLNGLPDLAEVEPDPERITSLGQLKALAGSRAASLGRFPTRMLADLHFEHAALFEAGEVSNPVREFASSDETRLVFAGAPLLDGSGRRQHLYISQSLGRDNPTLDALALAGGYSSANVDGEPAIFRQDCWDDPLAGGVLCRASLDWYEGGVWIEMITLLDRAIPQELLVAIAESLD